LDEDASWVITSECVMKDWKVLACFLPYLLQNSVDLRANTLHLPASALQLHAGPVGHHPRHSPGTPQALPRHSPGTPQALPRRAPSRRFLRPKGGLSCAWPGPWAGGAPRGKQHDVMCLPASLLHSFRQNASLEMRASEVSGL